MSESLESFVKKLQEEGVDAGRKAAEAILQEAREEADAILADARREAEEIVAEAQARGRAILARTQAEMELAVRDALLKLRRSFDRILSTLLTARTEKELSDPGRLAAIIREVVTAYARADAAGEHPFQLRLPERMRHELDRFVLDDLLGNLGADPNGTDVRATLSRGGFEYRFHGGTVEVTAESVAEVLFDMVSPRLQELIEKILAEPGGAFHENTGGSPGDRIEGDQ